MTNSKTTEGKKPLLIQDIWKISQKRKASEKKIGYLIYDLNYKIKYGVIKEDEATLGYINKHYKIDHRTIKKYLGANIFSEGNKKIISFDKIDIEYLKETITIVEKYKELPRQKQKLIKPFISYLLSLPGQK